MKTIGPIDPEEIKVIKVPFADEIGDNTIVTAEPTSRVLEGVDADAASMVQGLAVISGSDVLVRIKGMKAKVLYEVKVKVTDSNGLVHVERPQILVKE